LGASNQERKTFFPLFSFWTIKKKVDCKFEETEERIKYYEQYGDEEENTNEDAVSDHTFRQQTALRKSEFGRDGKLLYDSEEDIHYASEGQISQRSNSNDLIASQRENKKREFSEGEIAKNHFVEMAKRNKYIKDTGKVQHLISTM
jgi:hypothetical protein